MGHSIDLDLLIVGQARDPHIDWVGRELTDRGLTWACIDQTSVADDGGSFDPARQHLRVGAIDVAACRLIWLRRPYPAQIRRLSLGDAAFARAEIAEFLFGSLWALGAEWHSTPSALKVAGHKPAQLARAAADPRLRVPPTLITSSPDDARAFLGSDPEAYIVKPLSSAQIENDETVEALFTTRVTPALVDRLDALRHAPCIIQRFVPRAYDVRINVVGDAVFATRLDTDHDPRAVDDHRHVFYKDMRAGIIDPPAGVAAACRAMCADFSLSFGAFDFAVSAADEWYFLEVNPWGQWAWIEELTGQPLSAAFADFFAARCADLAL